MSPQAMFILRRSLDNMCKARLEEFFLEQNEAGFAFNTSKHLLSFKILEKLT
jgi:hypothetical protein